jgi:tRNA (cmo5U34)-methyltransferase
MGSRPPGMTFERTSLREAGTLTETTTENQWSEENSREFLHFADIVFPHRQEQNAVLTALIPANQNEPFVAVDLGCGAGPLSRAILARFPECSVVGLDGSPLMLKQAESGLADFAGRFAARSFDLFQSDWLDTLPDRVRCFVSSLAIHHLDGPGKQRLFTRLAERLEPGGAILIQDLIEPTTERGWQINARMWDAYAKEQSVRMTGSLDYYDTFVNEGWNHFATPDLEFDLPSGLFEQLRWLEEAGLSGADCFWLWYGHAIYGAFKPAG